MVTEIKQFIRVPIWNSFDEFGLLLGLERLPGETNREFRLRIYNAGKYFGSATKQGLVNALSIELGCCQYNATNKTFFFLSYQPVLRDPGTNDQLSFRVWVNNEEWQNFDLHPDAENYFKLWKLENGATTRILEISDTFNNGEPLKIIYYRIEDNEPERWVDEYEYPNERFMAYKKETPVSGQIEFFELNDPDFKNEYLLDGDGNPKQIYKSFVEEIHRIYPILWNKFIWDYTAFDCGDEKITGLEHLPSRFDASRTYITSGDFISGVGYGTDCAVHDGITHINYEQKVLIHPGYFTLCDYEFYLFGHKCRELPPASGSVELFEFNDPIIITNISGQCYWDDNFAEPWTDYNIDTHYLHVQDLSGCISGDWDPNVWDVPWFTIDNSGAIEISGEKPYEEHYIEYGCLSGNYECDIDFNPCHFANFTDNFLVIRLGPLVPDTIEVTYVDWYIKRKSNEYDANTSGCYPDNDITIRVDIYDKWRAPINDPSYSAEFSIYYNELEIASAIENLSDDGSCWHTFHDLTERNLVDPHDFLVTVTLLKDVIATNLKGYLTIPFGIEA